MSLCESIRNLVFVEVIKKKAKKAYSSKTKDQKTIVYNALKDALEAMEEAGDDMQCRNWVIEEITTSLKYKQIVPEVETWIEKDLGFKTSEASRSGFLVLHVNFPDEVSEEIKKIAKYI